MLTHSINKGTHSRPDDGTKQPTAYKVAHTNEAKQRT